MTGCARFRGVSQAAAARCGRRRAGRHPLRPARARRRSAHPLLVRGEQRGDRAGHRAHRRFVRKHEAMAALDRSTGARATRSSVACARRSASSGDDPAARARSGRVRRRARHGPSPAMPADLVERFIERATHMESTVERIASLDQVPAAVARYLDALDLPPAIAQQKSREGVCWPEFGGSRLARRRACDRGATDHGHDRLGITGCLCAIAETGTLVLIPGAADADGNGAASRYACRRAAREPSCPTMEDAFARVRAERGACRARST